MEISEPSSFQLGQQCLKEGDVVAAVKHLEAAMAEPQGLTLDGHLLMAEALWQQAGSGGTATALPHYEAALKLAREAGDSSKEAAVSLGHGFALLQLGRGLEARETLRRAHALAEEDKNPAAMNFIDGLLKQAEAAMSPQEQSVATWQQFAAAFTHKRPVLFMRGNAKSPGDEASALGVLKLREAGVKSLKVVDVWASGPEVPEGLQTLSNFEVPFPQLFVQGASVENWTELPAEELTSLLKDNGVLMSEPGEKKPEEPGCHGSFSEGLQPWEVVLVELVSKQGAKDWGPKLQELQERGLEEVPSDVLELEEAWARLSPIVKEKLEKQPEMPCGHSCNTCPTKHDCQLHDAVGHVRDIEDLL
ncbi:unnamed protein product [Polarella glacialis]|uniref:Uncharacterized protein n=1 Tax=Polarella glacialis TaxID=89957 RepID=A0A813E0W1_POLGL|nr:unnamed protein product [Polarella glacialis]